MWNTGEGGGGGRGGIALKPLLTISGRLDTVSAAHTFAPEEIPTARPY